MKNPISAIRWIIELIQEMREHVNEIVKTKGDVT